MFFDEDDSEPSHPALTTMGVTVGLLVYAFFYALLFTVIAALVMVPLLLIMAILDGLFDLNELGIDDLITRALMGASALAALVSIELRGESMRAIQVLPRAARAVRRSFAIHHRNLQMAEFEALEQFADAHGSSLLGMAAARSSSRRVVWLHSLHLGASVVLPPAATVGILYWALMVQRYEIAVVVMSAVFALIPGVATWFYWMGMVSNAALASSVEARKVSVGARVARERVDAQAGALTFSADSSLAGRVSLTPADDGLTLLDDSEGS